MVVRGVNFNKLIIAGVVINLSIGSGIAGFMLIEDYTFIDAIYMTLITISTVGFQEVKPLSDNGKLFTSIFIFFNLGILAYIISVISTYVFEGELRDMLSNYTNLKKMKNLKGHIIVCGFGRNGSKACDELLSSGHKIVVIDNNEETIKETDVNRNPNLFFIEGDATNDDILKNAGIEHAKALITTMPKDADNVFVTLTARQLNHSINIISRASEESSENKLIRAGANKIVMPDAVGGRHMATLVTKPEIIEFIEMINGIGEGSMKLDHIPFSNLKEEWRGKSIGELDIRKKTGAMVIALKDQFGFTFNPNAHKALSEGQTMIIIGSSDELKKLSEFKMEN